MRARRLTCSSKAFFCSSRCLSCSSRFCSSFCTLITREKRWKEIRCRAGEGQKKLKDEMKDREREIEIHKVSGLSELVRRKGMHVQQQHLKETASWSPSNIPREEEREREGEREGWRKDCQQVETRRGGLDTTHGQVERVTETTFVCFAVLVIVTVLLLAELRERSCELWRELVSVGTRASGGRRRGRGRCHLFTRVQRVSVSE